MYLEFYARGARKDPCRSLFEMPVFFCSSPIFNQNLELVDKFGQNSSVSDLLNLCSAVTESLPADRQT
jgi:hypothetical protein